MPFRRHGVFYFFVARFISMTPDFLRKFESAVSTRRLSAYQAQNGDNSDIEILMRYVWNIKLCESFYPILQSLEIALRNSLHENICASQNNQQWLRSSCVFLRNQERQLVLNAENQLQAQGKTVDSDRLIAELNFGFWTSLLNTHYETQGLWPRLLRAAFPHIARRQRTRRIVARRLNDIRHFRNRIFHHETIWHSPNLQLAHDDILESIGWMNLEMRQIAKIVDDFPTVCQPSYRDGLRQKLASSIVY